MVSGKCSPTSTPSSSGQRLGDEMVELVTTKDRADNDFGATEADEADTGSCDIFGDILEGD